MAPLAFATDSERKDPAMCPCPGDSAFSEYVIGPLDVLEIDVWDAPKLSGPVNVRPDGYVSMKIVGQLHAAGLTTAQFTDAVTKKLLEIMVAPEVNIQILRYNSKSFYIEGGVSRPGEFPLTKNLTVFDALASGAGFREFAKKNKIYILRAGEKIPFNYDQVVAAKHMEQNVRVLDGDHIVVPE